MDNYFKDGTAGCPYFGEVWSPSCGLQVDWDRVWLWSS